MAKQAANRKPINLGLQGGGAHGAFTWGVIDGFLEQDCFHIDGLSGTSAGALNAAVYAYGMMHGGRQGARDALEHFWSEVSRAGQMYSPIKRMPWEAALGGFNMDNSVLFSLFETFTRSVSPYQFNPLDFNPLRDILNDCVDFDEIKACDCAHLFISATNVRTGKAKVFETEDVTLDVIMASACLPFLFKAVEINGEAYWDGGYMGNPVIYPFYYHTETDDVVIIHVNPIERPDVPTTASDIFNRINEISFNSSLLKEFRAIGFVQKLLHEGRLKDDYAKSLRDVRLHAVSADDIMTDLSVASKLNTNWHFLCELRDRGRAAAQDFTKRHYADIGNRNTLDLRL